MADINIAAIREKYPQYNDLSDEKLAHGLHQKFYSDLPFDAFAGKIGFKAQSKEAQSPAETPTWTESGMVDAPSAGAERTAQTQVTADINALGQGALHGTGALIAGVGRIAAHGAAKGTEKQLAVMDAIDRGEAAPQDQDTIGYQSLSMDQRAKVRSQFEGVSGEIAARNPNAMVRTGEAIQQGATNLFPVEAQNEGTQTGVGRLIGGAVPALGGIAAGTAVGGPAGGILTGMAMIGSQAYDTTYQEAVAKGASPEQAEDAAGKSAAAQAITQTVPIARLIQRVPMPLRDGLTKTLINLGQNGVEFGSANAIGTFANNYVARETYDPERSLTQGTGDAALEGAIAGLIIPSAIGVVRGARQADATRDAGVAKIMGAENIDSAIADARALAQSNPSFDNLRGDTSRPALEAPSTPGIYDWGEIFSPRARENVPSEETAMELRPEAVPTEPIANPWEAARNRAPSPTNSAQVKKIASEYYQKADEVGGTLTPEFTNKFIETAEGIAPQTSEGRAIAGETAVTKLIDRVQTLRDEPVSLRGAQEIDEYLGDLIDREYGLKGLSKEGRNLFDLQTTFRDMIMDAKPEDTTTGTEGFEALRDGRKAWSQAMKMMDLERIQERAEMTDNPATSIKSGIRVLLSNKARSRGYDQEEIAALKTAGERGVIGSVLHVFGSRLIPIGLGSFGAATLNPAAIAAAGAGYAGAALARRGATNLQNRRLDAAMSVLGQSVPQPP